jgi:putative drug exporter of the RND superfamily
MRSEALKWPGRVVAAAVLVFVACILLGAPVVDRLSSGGLVDSSAPSVRADAILGTQFRVRPPDFVVLVQDRAGMATPAARAAGTAIVTGLRALGGVQDIRSYWTTPSGEAGLRSADGRSALITAFIPDGPRQALLAAAGQRLVAQTTTAPQVHLVVGGLILANEAVTHQVRADFEFAEEVTFPVTALALLWVFGSLYAAMIPLATGLLATAGTLAVLRLIVALTPVSIFALNLATGLSLALAIDYSLLLVSRYREERRDSDGRPAVRRTLNTAGRTVLLSASTVAFSLSALAIFPMYALRSFAYAGVAVVVFAAATALILTPALLLFLGATSYPAGRGHHKRPLPPRVDRLDIRRPFRRPSRGATDAAVLERSMWYRVSGAVIRHAMLTALTVVAILVLFGMPFLRARWGPADDRVLPSTTAVRQVGDVLRSEFAATQSSLVTILVPRPSSAGSVRSLALDAARLSAIPGISRAVAPSGVYRHGLRVGPSPEDAMAAGRWAYLSGYGAVAPLSPAGSRLLTQVRNLPWAAGALITGPIAENADTVASIGRRLPLVMAVVALATVAMVFLLTRSVLLPIKALLLTVLSLTASFGVLVWVFQEGHLMHQLFGSTASGFLIPYVPLVMFCLAFGMSMDYEIFLLSRISEEWRASPQLAADNDRAVRLGLAKTGRVVSAAALFMVIVFAGLATSRVTLVEMIGTGLGLFVLVDSTLIRGLLLPAFMHLAGRANWWAPAVLRRKGGRPA